MTYLYKEHLSGANVTLYTDDKCKIDSNGFYKIDSYLKSLNPDTDWGHIAHDLKYRGLNATKKHAINTDTGVEIDLPEHYSVFLIREPLKRESDNWQETSHLWCVDINGESFKYYTGIGHRTAKATRYNREDFERLTGWNVRLTEHGFESLLRCSVATPPSVLDVLYSLSMDSHACGESFESWCMDFGYDTDLRKALEIYLECQGNASKLRKAGINVNAMQEFLQDY